MTFETIGTEKSVESTDTKKSDSINEVEIPVVEKPKVSPKGWLTVAAYALFNFSTWGSNASFSVYLTHYIRDNKFPNASKLDFAAIGGLQYGAGLLIIPFFSEFIISRLSERGLILVGVTSQFLANICASYTKEKWQLYITQGVLQAFGIAFIVVPGYSIIPKWFRSGNKTFAQGLTNCGTSIGGLFFCLFNEYLITKKGVDFTLRIQCAICIALDIGGLLLIQIPDKGADTKIQASLKSQFRTITSSLAFWLQQLWGVLNMVGFLICLYVLSDFTVSLGFTSHQGSIVASMVSVGAVFGRPICGILSDRLGSINITLFTQSIMVILIFAMWIPAKSIPVMILFGLFSGSVMGTIFTSMSSITVEVLNGDLTLLVNTLNIFLCILAVGSTLAPILALALKSGANYKHAIIFTGFINVGSVLALLALRYHLLKRDKLLGKEVRKFYRISRI